MDHEAKNQGGRPTKYRPAHNKLVYSMCLLGATDKEIADAFDIAVSTLYEWKNTYPKFAEAMRNGKMPADAEAAEGLHKRAKGYSYKEVSYEQIDNTDKQRKKVTVKVVPPDPGAAINWLKNRRPDQWRTPDNIDIDDKRDTGNKLDLSHLTFEQLKELKYGNRNNSA